MSITLLSQKLKDETSTNFARGLVWSSPF